MEKPLLYVLNCGGTIDMVKEETADLPDQPINFEDVIYRRIPRDAFDIEVDKHFLRQDSSDAVMDDWVKIAKECVKVLTKSQPARGVLISHGTDSLSFTVDALSYMVQHLDRTVAATGAQIPLRNKDQTLNLKSDGFTNLPEAAYVATFPAEVKVPGNSEFRQLQQSVLVFNSKVFDTRNVRKADAEALDAFENVHHGPLGIVTREHNQNETPNSIVVHDSDRVRIKDSPGKIEFDGNINGGVASPREVYPVTDPDDLASYLNTPRKRGFVLKALGTGNLPTRVIKDNKGNVIGFKEGSLLPVIEDATYKGKLVVITTQPRSYTKLIEGYELGKHLQLAGAVTSGDMVAEQAYVRLNFVLAHMKELEEFASQARMDVLDFAKAMFWAGVKLDPNPETDRALKKQHKEKTGVSVYPTDNLRYNAFSRAAQQVAEFQRLDRYS